MTFDPARTPSTSVSDGVLTLPVSLTTAGNALDEGCLSEAIAALTALAEGEIDAGAVLLVGLGKNFCAGGNVAGFAAAEDRSAHVREVADLLHSVIRHLESCTVPVVAAVSGWAAGAGLSLTLTADISVGNADTKLLPAYPSLGLSPDGGMSWRLPRAIGPMAARTFLLQNKPVAGPAAQELGLITVLVDGDVEASAREIAVSLADGPRAAFARTKALLRAAETSSLDAQLDAERDSISQLASHPDGIEGVDAFLGKRAPKFGEHAATS